MDYRPEGCIFSTESNQRMISSYEGLAEAMEKGIILEAKAVLCTSTHDLIVELPCDIAFDQFDFSVVVALARTEFCRRVHAV